jgi:hypothetical protein
MREQDRPAIADPLVEFDRSFSGLAGKIRRFAVDAEGHSHSPYSPLTVPDHTMR